MGIQNTGQTGSFINGQFPSAAGAFARVGTGVFSGLKTGESAGCPYTFTPSAVGGTATFVMFLSNAGPATVLLTGAGVPVVANDSCSTPSPVINDTAMTFSTAGAITDGPMEGNLGFCCGDLQVNQDVWFIYTAACTGTASVSLCGSNFDTKVAIYDGTTCPVSPNTAIAGNDDFCGLQSYAEFPCIGGNQYLIRVGGFAVHAGNAQMTVSCGPPWCRGDFNGDGAFNALDTQEFVDALLGGETCPMTLLRASPPEFFAPTSPKEN